ncbi:hypothetical protein [Nodosilinea nodulosa]|uniref:hypothetical protein n=1 Tax=Nodosilinea nodulosa TaxID=416001 RepID=UPI0012D85065|nr:hypothetical protein [Nodosilinea nodulosa]
MVNLRQQRWADHFIWPVDGIRLIGVPSTGRATCDRLDLNDNRRPDTFIQTCRQQWSLSGLHPSKDDLRQSE